MEKKSKTLRTSTLHILRIILRVKNLSINPGDILKIQKKNRVSYICRGDKCTQSSFQSEHVVLEMNCTYNTRLNQLRLSLPILEG